MASQALERIAASPYARRLARERGINLSGRRGSGPNGRIVAADLEAFVAAPVPTPATAPVAAAETPAISPPLATAPAIMVARQVSGFAASFDLAPVRGLLPAIADVAPDVTVDDLVLKAIGRALRVAEVPAETVLWRDKAAKAEAVIPRADGLSPSRIAALRSGLEQEPMRGASIVVSRIREDGIRPVAAMLDPDNALRLTIVSGNSDTAEALLAFDEAEITDAAAARFLAALRDCLGNPLRLLV
ncbi:E3 binding domain-containing protein [Kaistia dalseonensis]|uniref:Pyruvate dehydrogenase E2 component (Dihydrolipoamide acetyltransferase) n=1 Tax=Kaistia dalseonensis TaxID=410840 RepID=A0ABU0H2X5_9HYPH|nr:E3 binding domain-containing protein [Kaistia dalseonensis]MCX5494072.1 E3 binding domain-containing protein [Kaistia dalseonensis]MDQ0436650.1 pyruvate dehydrogenase E2 component (dihydrolipoamide acetyltransferase) [Kaistia dalseonensis]